MAVKIGINGFGRIGRCALRAAWNDPEIEFVHINDLTGDSLLAHLLSNDSVHGPFDQAVTAVDGGLDIGGTFVPTSAEPNPANLPWQERQVDVVFECTGIFRKRADAAKHITAGAKKVLISAPGKGGLMPIIRTWARLAQTAWEHRADNIQNLEEKLDPFWTLTGYFNANRELAGALGTYSQDIRERVQELAKIKANLGLSPNDPRPLDPDRCKELSGRIIPVSNSPTARHNACLVCKKSCQLLMGKGVSPRPLRSSERISRRPGDELLEDRGQRQLQVRPWTQTELVVGRSRCRLPGEGGPRARHFCPPDGGDEHRRRWRQIIALSPAVGDFDGALAGAVIGVEHGVVPRHQRRQRQRGHLQVELEEQPAQGKTGSPQTQEAAVAGGGIGR